MSRTVFLLLVLSLPTLPVGGAEQPRPNILIVTVDDMSADSLGAFGCKLDDTSPNIDAFAKSALRFNHAHVLVGNCMPGRNIMWSGLYSHVNGVEGFQQNKNPDYPVLCDLAQQAGYFAGIRGKVSHSTPYHPYAWDAVLDTSPGGKKYHIKDADSYGESTRKGIAMAEEAGKPFCLLVNISDPHKPFYAQGKNGVTIDDPHVPTRVFTCDEVPIPGFLFDDSVVRKELAHYYSSVRRADDCFAKIMEALDESGQADNTFIMFLSDHGMPLPFAKTQLWHHSTHTPLMVRYPGVTKAGTVDDHHMVSAIDFVPTLLEVMGHEHPTPERLHGQSFASILRGEQQTDRDQVILQYNENAGGNRHPMRGIETCEFLYLYNPWSDGKRKFATATTGTMTYRQMQKRAENETDIAIRLTLFDHRVTEELYDIRKDPDCLVNLIGDPKYDSVHKDLRTRLASGLAKLDDPATPLLQDVENVDLRTEYMAAEDARTLARRKAKQGKNKKAKADKAKDQAKRDAKNKSRIPNAIRVEMPSSVKRGEACRITVHHKIPDSMGKQKLHITLKRASTATQKNLNQRIHREVVTVSGSGKTEIDFDVPSEGNLQSIKVSAFAGEDHASNFDYLTTKPVAVE